MKLHYKKYKEIKSTTESYNQITKNSIASSVDDSIKYAIDFEISENIRIAKLSVFNEVLFHFPDSEVELEGSYQTKQKQKINKKVDSQVDSKNNKDAVKNQIPNIDVNSVEKKMNNERTEKILPGEKRVCIVGDRVIKYVNGYKISVKLKEQKRYYQEKNAYVL